MSFMFSDSPEADLATGNGPEPSADLSANAITRRQVPLDGLADRDELLNFAYEYWQSKRDGGLLPTRDSIDILDLRPVLKITHMVDVTSEVPEDWTFRVVGSVVPRDWDWSSGRPALSACPWPPFKQMLVEDYGSARFTGVPLYHEIAARVDWVEYTYSRIILTLADDGRNVNTLMVCINRREIPDLRP